MQEKNTYYLWNHYDPVLLAIGQGTMGDRLHWIETDLNQENWLDSLPGETQVDAVLSTTALHWLSIDCLVKLYQQLGQLVRPGGIFLNGDHLYFSPHLATFSNLAKTVHTRRKHQAFIEHHPEDWERWWQAIDDEPDLKE